MPHLAVRQFANMTDHGNVSEVNPSVPSVSQNGDAQNAQISISLLISEIKKHPILYHRAQTEFLEKIEKQKEWARVCENIFKQWHKLCPRKKRDKVREVQAKWLKLKESFLKSYSGVQKLSPLAKKRKQQHYNRLSFLIPTTVTHDKDMGVNNNNEATSDLGIDTFDRTQEEAIPSTSAQSVANFAKTHEVKKKPLFIQIPKIEQPPQDPIDENMHFALMIVPLLRNLNTEQRYYAWPHIIEVLQRAGEVGKKICVLQNELRYPDDAGPSMMQELNYPVPVPVPEPEPEAALEEEAIFPVSRGRPTNEQGEIIYPETDNEDMDEI